MTARSDEFLPFPPSSYLSLSSMFRKKSTRVCRLPRRAFLQTLEQRHLLAGDWQNPVLAEDVDYSGYVSTSDLLLVVTDLRTEGNPHDLTASPPDDSSYYYDPSGDNVVAVNDLLAIVDVLRAGVGIPAPTLEATLANDTGEPGDRVTADPTLNGRIVNEFAPETRLLARVDNGPWVRVTPTSTGEFSFLASLNIPDFSDGPHGVQFVGQSAGGTPAFLDISFTLHSAFAPPEFDPVGPLFVSPGQSLATALSASDPQGQPVTFSIVGVSRLPSGKLTGNGLLTFTPTPSDLGEHTFTLIASNGVQTARQEVTLTVMADAETTTRIAGVVQNADEQPLAGVPVELGSQQTVTAADGSFVLMFEGQPESDRLIIRGDQIPAAEGEDGQDAAYPLVEIPFTKVLGHDAYEGERNEIPLPIYLPKLDTAGARQVNPDNPLTQVESVAFAGASLAAATSAIRNADGSPFTGSISLSQLVRNRTPVPTPDRFVPDVMATIEPSNLRFSSPAHVTLPNRLQHPPGTYLHYYSLNPDTADYEFASLARVSDDGAAVETVLGGITRGGPLFAVWVMPKASTLAAQSSSVANDGEGETTARNPESTSEGDEGEDETPKNACPPCPPATASTSSEVELYSGAYREMHALPAYQSLGTAQRVALSYDSLRADPQPITRFSFDAAPMSHGESYLYSRVSLDLGGFQYEAPGYNGSRLGALGGENYWSLEGFDRDNPGERLGAGLQLDLRTHGSGVFSYTLTAGSVMENDGEAAGRATEFTGEVVHVNLQDSPFGAGWGLAGWQEIVENPNGSLLLIDGDGSERVFLAPLVPGLNEYLSPVGDFSKMERLEDDRFRRTLKDGTVYEFNAQNKLASMTDRNGNQTQYVYDAGHRLVKMIDPVGMETVFSYTGENVSSITDPAGRETRLEHDGAGNLVRIVNPDETERRWNYDDRHLLTIEITPRGHTERTYYNEFGRAIGGERADGTTVAVAPVDARGMGDPRLTAHPDTAPEPDFDFRREAVVVNGRGHAEHVTLDRIGQRVTSRDEIGPRSTVVRDDDNQVTQLIDARGNAVFTARHDSRGNAVEIRDEVTFDRRPPGPYFPGRHVGPADVVADVNGDGLEDVLGVTRTRLFPANEYLTQVQVRLGRGNGDFDEAQTFDPGWDMEQPQQLRPLAQVAVGDFNADGLVDIVAYRVYTINNGRLQTTHIAVLLGRGKGEFETAVTFEYPELFGRLQVADANDDGAADLVLLPPSVAFSTPRKAVILLSQGDGTFTEAYVTAPEVFVSDVVLGDLDGDGISDLTALQSSGGARSLQWRPGLGDGSFGEPQNLSLPTPTFYGLLRAADVNGDDRLDLIAIDRTRAAVLLNEGFGEFAEPIVSLLGFLIPPDAVSFTVQDVTGDNLVDLVISASTSSSTSTIPTQGFIATGRGDGAFDLPQAWLGHPVEHGFADFDRDGRLDVITGPGNLFRGDATGGFHTGTTYDAGASVSHFQVRDVNGDDRPDVITTSATAGTVSVLLGLGDGSLSESVQYSVADQPRSLTLGDVNGDGHLDVVTAHGSDTLTLLLGDGTGQFARGPDIPLSGEIRKAVLADINGDGVLDLAAGDLAGEQLLIALGDGAGSFTPTSQTTLTVPPSDFAVADIDGDDLPDVGGVGEYTTWAAFGDGHGGLEDIRSSADNIFGTPSYYERVFLADWNGDGFLDIAAVGQRESRHKLLESTGRRTFSTLDGSGFQSQVRAIADFDGDGRPELMALGSVIQFDASGPGSVATPVASFAVNSDGVASDLDNDGDLDFVSFNISSSNVVVSLNVAEEMAEVGAQTAKFDPQFNQPLVTTDYLRRRTTNQIDPANGNIVSRSRSNGGGPDQTTQFTYTSRGLISQVSDPLGRRTALDYDNAGRLIARTFASGTPDQGEQQYEYDEAGNITASHDENGQRTEFEYDELNRLTLVRDPLGNEARFVYDEMGNVVEQTDARGNVTHYEYDERNRVIRGTDPAGGVTQYEYDEEGNLVRVVDPLGHATQHEYDARNRLVQSTDADGGVTRYEYDPDNNVTALTDPVGNVTRFEYDARSRLVREIDPLGAATVYTYDDADNVVAKVDRNGRRTEYVYDDLNRRILERWIGDGSSPDHEIAYTYDAADNLLTATDAFSSLAYTYDARDRMATVDNAGTPGPPQVVLEYTYDAAGNVASVADTIDGAPGALTTYQYDEIYRVTRLTQSGADVAEKRVDFAYNPLGQFASIDRYADLSGSQLVVSTSYAYDGKNRLTDLVHNNGQTDVAFYRYQYDDADRLTQITDISGATGYSYDELNRLRTADRDPTDLRGDESYDFDANGNRTNSHLHNEGYETSAGNRLISDGQYNYDYDAEGNLIRRTETATGDYRILQWDHRNRLRDVLDFDADNGPRQIVSFVYDALDRRILKFVDETPADAADAVVYAYVYDGANVILDFIDSDGSGLAMQEADRRYLHGPLVDQVMAEEGQGESTEWHLADHLGTIHHRVNDSGVITKHNLFDSYGRLLSPGEAGRATQFLYTGREFDAETDLYFYRARAYDASIGAFISEDPIGFASKQTNLYSYVGSMPTMYRDPNGLEAEESRLVQWVDQHILRPIVEHPGLGANADKAIDYRAFLNHVNGRTYDEVASEKGWHSAYGLVWPLGPSNEVNFVNDPANPSRVIDMKHFLTVGKRGNFLGLLNEFRQLWDPLHQGVLNFDPWNSAFNAQDFFSNYLGTEFFNSVDPSKSFEENLREFFENRERLNPCS